MPEPTYEELKAKLSQLEKQVETRKKSGTIEFKVGEKGGVSVYGLGRFPVTLYYEQWNRLLSRRRRPEDIHGRKQVEAQAQRAGLNSLLKNSDFGWRSASSAAIKPFISTQALAAEVPAIEFFSEL